MQQKVQGQLIPRNPFSRKHVPEATSLFEGKARSRRAGRLKSLGRKFPHPILMSKSLRYREATDNDEVTRSL